MLEMDCIQQYFKVSVIIVTYFFQHSVKHSSYIKYICTIYSMAEKCRFITFNLSEEQCSLYMNFNSDNKV